MSTGGELQLLDWVQELADDILELAGEVTGLLGGARNAGLDPQAISGLVGAAFALGADQIAVYTAGSASPGAAWPDDITFLARVSDAEDETADALTAADRYWKALLQAVQDARGARARARQDLATARAMAVRSPCHGCHGTRAAAVDQALEALADAGERLAVCQSAADVLAPLIVRLRHALARLQAVPADLGETYESVYALIRSGGRMPREGRWITGEDPRPAIHRRPR